MTTATETRKQAERTAREHIKRVRERMGSVAWAAFGPEIRRALVCAEVVHTISSMDDESVSADTAKRMIAAAHEVMAADYE